MHAGIAGAGIMGSLLALGLYQRGWQVSLFDYRKKKTNCSASAAGLLAPTSELDRADKLIFRLGLESLTHWPDILKRLPFKVFFQNKGSLVVNHPQDEAMWTHFRQRIAQQLPESTVYQRLSQGMLAKLEPDLLKFTQAYYFKDEAQLDCQRFMRCLKQYLKASISFFSDSPVLMLQAGKIQTKQTSYGFDRVFDCRGLGAQAQFADLRPLRGELLWLQAPAVHFKRPIRLLHPRYNLYLLPRPKQIYLLGASELETGDLSPISVRTTLELLTGVYSLHKGFAEARILKTATHCRPTLANHLPRIQSGKQGIAVNGLYRHGYLIAPALVAEILRAVYNKPLHYPELWETI